MQIGGKLSLIEISCADIVGLVICLCLQFHLHCWIQEGGDSAQTRFFIFSYTVH